VTDTGELQKRVELQTLQAFDSQRQDRYGQAPPVWTAVGTFWAKIKTLSGRELVNAQQVKATVTHSIRMRYQGAGVRIAPDMRFLYAGRFFNIGVVLNEDERNVWLDILCTEQKVPAPS
jgi:SPP1 family predicted phage head-tail adaptor